MPASPTQQTQQIVQQCHDAGFAAAGVAPASQSAYRDELRNWLAAGKHGEMMYMAANVDLRVDPTLMVPGAQSIICVADRYHRGGRDARMSDQPHGRIARYARGRDYHVVMKKRLHTLCDALQQQFPSQQFRACVDTAPVLEREHAQRAGVGSIGKHTLLIERGVGSYLLLGEIITTLKLEPSADGRVSNPCNGCTRCIDACPTDAITPWSVDATRCISYLTIEHRSVIDEQYHEAIGDWIFGCDICQEVCPHNQPTRRSKQQPIHDAYVPQRQGFDLLEVLNWTEQDRRDAFTQSPMKRAKLAMMKRNALIAAGNAIKVNQQPELQQRIKQIVADDGEDELVRQTARQVLNRLHQG